MNSGKVSSRSRCNYSTSPRPKLFSFSENDDRSAIGSSRCTVKQIEIHKR